MGCGASKSQPGVTAPEAVQQNTYASNTTDDHETRKISLATTRQEGPQNPSQERAAPVNNEKAGGLSNETEADIEQSDEPSKTAWGSASLVTSAVTHPQQAGLQKSSSRKSTSRGELNFGKVSAKVSSILQHEEEDDDDIDGQGLAEIPSADAHHPTSQGGTFLMQGAAKTGSRTSNPVSDTFMEAADSSIQSQMKPVKPAPRKAEDPPFSNIAATNNTLPSLTSFQRRAEPDWLAPSALDDLGENEGPAAGNGNMGPDAVQPFNSREDDVLVLNGDDEEEEEEDAFDMNGITAPVFNHVQGNAAVSVPEQNLGDPEDVDSDDPWASLQNQYQIRDDMGSPTFSGRKEHRKSSKSGVRAGHSEWASTMAPDEELVLDTDDVMGAIARAKQAPVGSSQRAKQVGSVRSSSGPREASWAQGEMAQAGDIMLGHGALDADHGGLASGASVFSAGGFEHGSHSQSFDMTTLEVPAVHSKGADIAMEDFIDEIETYGSKAGGIQPSLADKLAQFEAGFDDDEDMMIQEELRIMSSNNS